MLPDCHFPISILCCEDSSLLDFMDKRFVLDPLEVASRCRNIAVLFYADHTFGIRNVSSRVRSRDRDSECW